MDSSIVPRKRRLIDDHFSPGPAPVRSTTRDRTGEAQVSTSSAAGPSTSKLQLMGDEIPDSDASDGDDMLPLDNWRNLGPFKPHFKISADDMVGKAPEPYDSDAELDDSDNESLKGKEALESDFEYEESDEDDDFIESLKGKEALESDYEYRESDEDDDDYIANQTDPSPEKGDSSQLDNSVAVFCSSADFKRPFAVLLRGIIQFLMNWAQNDIPIDHSLRAMNPSYWKAFRDLDIDAWLEKFLKAIPEQVQALFEKESWSFDDLLALPSSERIPKSQGVYGIFFRSEYRGQERDMGYVGAAPTGLEGRFDTHRDKFRQARAGKLSPRLRASKLHRHAGRRDFPLESSFKVLAVFEEYTEQSYVYMLEGLFMVLFRTFYFQYEYKTNTRASFDLFNKVCDTVGITQQLFGLNEAWCLTQRFPHPLYSVPSRCINPACGEMTWPIGMKSQKTLGGHRVSYRGDPSNGFLCGYCYHYRDGKLLPNAETIAERNRLRDEQQGLIDPICDGCHQPRSVIIEDIPNKWAKGFHKKDGKRYCRYCYDYLCGMKEEPSLEDFKKNFRDRWMRQAATQAVKNGEYNACQNCGSTPKLGYHKPTEKVLCEPCRKQHRNSKRQPYLRPLNVAPEKRQIEDFAREKMPQPSARWSSSSFQLPVDSETPPPPPPKPDSHEASRRGTLLAGCLTTPPSQRQIEGVAPEKWCQIEYVVHEIRRQIKDVVHEKRRQIKEAVDRGETITCYLPDCSNKIVKGKAVISKWGIGPVCQKRQCQVFYKVENARHELQAALHAP